MIVAGVDECGRGPLAGPVVAAAVILPDKCSIEGLTDSKKLSASKRAQLEPMIKNQAIAWAIAQVDVALIDDINILQASLLAMKNALLKLDQQPDKELIDGKFIPAQLNCEAQAIIKGDSKFDAISAASVLAKEYRDRLMCDYDQRYPGYGFAAHKGYPTAFHISALEKYGVTAIHRRTFSPVAKLLVDV